MHSLWFVIPAHGRLELAAACYHALEWTIRELHPMGVDASAVVIADDENLELAREYGFATVERSNQHLGRKLNDGIEFAARSGIEYVAPLGSDDIVHPGWVAAAVPSHWMVCREHTTVVDETGERFAIINARLPIGASGTRVIPVWMLHRARYRPVPDDSGWGMDRWTNHAVHNAHRGRAFQYHELHPFEYVDFKTNGRQQLHPYRDVLPLAVSESPAPFDALAALYPAEVLDSIRAVYEAQQEEAA